MTARTTAVWLETPDGLMSFNSIREAAEYYADNTEPGSYPLAACGWYPSQFSGPDVVVNYTDGLAILIDQMRHEAAEGDAHIAHESAALRGAQI